MRRLLLSLILGSMLAGCGSSFLGPDPSTDPETLFEIFWESYDQYYAHFDLKGIDWDEVYVRYRPKVGPETSSEELFDVLADMIRELEDGHVYIVGDKRRALSDGHLRGPRRNFDSRVVEQTYLLGAANSAGEGNIIYGEVADGIGYVRLRTLSGGEGIGEGVEGWIRDLDRVLEEFSEMEGLVLDLRSNGGGRAYNAKFVASRFATERRPFIVTRSRNGPRHDDFSAPRTWYVEPGEGPIFDRPVVVLTNRYSFSAAEWLTLALRQYDHVTHIGTHSGGGLAMFLPRELPNGWSYTISVQDTRCRDGHSYERVGVAPEIFLENGDDASRNGNDSILETAIKHLRAAPGRKH